MKEERTDGPDSGTRRAPGRGGAAATPRPRPTSPRVGTPPGAIATPDPTPSPHTDVEGSPADTDLAHDRYWRASFGARDYTDESRGYEYYRPAYRFGWESRLARGAGEFETSEAELRQAWEGAAEERTLEWDEARPAVRDGWLRAGEVGETGPGNPLA